MVGKKPNLNDPYDVYDAKMTDQFTDQDFYGVFPDTRIEMMPRPVRSEDQKIKLQPTNMDKYDVSWEFDEGSYLRELEDYIRSTYHAHYAKGGKIQSFEIACERDRGVEAALFNMDKYNARYGHKGNVDDMRLDLLKNAHYAILALYAHDLKYGQQNED